MSNVSKIEENVKYALSADYDVELSATILINEHSIINGFCYLFHIVDFENNVEILNRDSDYISVKVTFGNDGIIYEMRDDVTEFVLTQAKDDDEKSRLMTDIGAIHNSLNSAKMDGFKSIILKWNN